MVEVIVEYDYIAKEPDELTIKKGDIIKDVVKKHGGWWEGTLNSKKGMFPDNFVRAMDKDSSVILRNKKDVFKIRQCRVVFSYNQDHEDELTLKVDDIINIIGEEEEGWWRGVLNGKEGVFPSNFVEEIVQNTSAPKPSSRDDLARLSSEIDGKVPMLPSKPTKQLCEVKYSYKAQNDDELSFKEGDIVTLISKDAQDPGWWKGELNGKIGVFPDNFVVLLPANGKDERKSSKIITETGAIKPSSIASQRKSLEVKTEKPPPPSDTNKTPPLPSKKPIITVKKSPSGSSAGGIFSEIKKKLVDVVDGATGSKSKTEMAAAPAVDPPHPENNNENLFDHVERKPLLSDVRATRAKAPGGRRPPTTIFKDEEADAIFNGTAEPKPEEPTADPSPNLPNSTSEIDAVETRPKLREWEKHKAPWLAEMKLSQAKRTSTSPGPPEQKLRLTPTEKTTAEPEESKSAKSSPLEKEASPNFDMSKSMSALSGGKLKTPPNELEKGPAAVVVKSKPSVPVPASTRHSLPSNPPKEVSVPAKPTVPIHPKISPVAAKPAPKPVVVPDKTVEPKHDSDAYSEPTTKQYSELLQRIEKLENLVEKQNRAIEELRNKLQLETDMRMMLQEKMSQNVMQV